MSTESLYKRLQSAVMFGEDQTFRDLIGQCLEIPEKEMLFLEAVTYKRSFMVGYLLNHGVDINSAVTEVFGQRVMHCAMCDYEGFMISYLMGRGADINAQNSRGQTPLYVAAKLNNIVGVKLLIDKKACAAIGKSALCVATKKNHTEIIDALQEYMAPLMAG